MSKDSNSSAPTGNGSFPNYNSPYDFVIQWIEESTLRRTELKQLVERTMKAYKGKPSKNKYKAYAAAYGNTLNDPHEKATWQKYCENIPDGRSDILRKSIETVVSQLQGGIGQYEYNVFDPLMEVDDDLIERLTSATEKFYIDSGLDTMKAELARDMLTNGAAYIYVTYDQEKKQYDAKLLEAWRVIADTNRGRHNRDRFLGFHQMESWIDVKKSLDFRGTKLVTLNDMDTYVKNINDVVRNPNFQSSYATENQLHVTQKLIYGSNYYKGRNTDQDLTADNRYRGDDVEVSYVWDLHENKRYKVLNRKYVIEAKDNDLTRNVKIPFIDPRTDEETSKTKKISMDCPIIEIAYLRHPAYNFPVTPVWFLLDDFDEICSAESLRSHNMSIMGPINFFGSPYDIEILTKAANIAGIGIEGMDGTAGVLNKQHDSTIVDGYIMLREQKIQRALNASDQYDLQQMIGDRASAKEAGTVSMMIAQGTNPLIASIEQGFSKAIRAFELLYVIYNEKGKFPFNNKSGYDEVTVQEIALDAIINVKLQSQIEFKAQMVSATAMSAMNFMLSSGQFDPAMVTEDFVPLITQGLISRKRARQYVIPEAPPPEAVAGNAQVGRNVAGQLNLEDAAVRANPDQALAQQAMSGMTPEEIAQLDQILAQGAPDMAAAGATQYVPAVGGPEDLTEAQTMEAAMSQMQQGPAAEVFDPAVGAGLGAEVGGEIANEMGI